MAKHETKTVTIEGLDEFEKQLANISVYALESAIVEGLTAGANMVEAEAKRLVPEKTGALRNAIKVRRGKRTNRGSFSVLCVVGRRYFVGDEFYGAFQEFGWKHGGRKGRKSSNRTNIPGEHFMEYAFDAVAPAAIQVVTNAIKAGIERGGAK